MAVGSFIQNLPITVQKIFKHFCVVFVYAILLCAICTGESAALYSQTNQQAHSIFTPTWNSKMV